MMQLSVEGMPSHFDCDTEIDAMPSAFDVANEVYGKSMFNISCICLQPQIQVPYTDFSDNFAMVEDDDDSYFVTGKIILHTIVKI